MRTRKRHSQNARFVHPENMPPTHPAENVTRVAQDFFLPVLQTLTVHHALLVNFRRLWEWMRAPYVPRGTILQALEVPRLMHAAPDRFPWTGRGNVRFVLLEKFLLLLLLLRALAVLRDIFRGQTAARDVSRVARDFFL